MQTATAPAATPSAEILTARLYREVTQQRFAERGWAETTSERLAREVAEARDAATVAAPTPETHAPRSTASSANPTPAEGSAETLDVSVADDAPTPGSTVSITNLYDATYIGEVVKVAGHLVTLRNYAAWHEGSGAPYNSPYYDDEVQVSVDAETIVDVQDAA